MLRLVIGAMEGDEAMFLLVEEGRGRSQPVYGQPFTETDHKPVPHDCYPLDALEAR
jgi:hypothetical protein